MARKNPAGKYVNIYAGLLKLYPRSYRRQFAEPMLQTFGDMYGEHEQAGDNMLVFAIGAYADTGMGIIKECSKEVVMNVKTTKGKIIVAVGLVTVVAVTASIVLLLSNSKPSVIPAMSSLKDARALSKGNKDACLTNNQQSREAVRSDDEFSGDTSYFELEASSGIMDVPAGTYYDVTVSSYEAGIVKGAVLYEKDYGTYNYSIEKISGKNQWKFVSMTACSKQ